jgi:recombinational DNA repair protein (RecF pathway)
MFLEHDAHLAAFDGFVASLEALNDPQRIDASLLSFQWMLLKESGYEPELHRDAQTGAALPDGAQTLAFSAMSGGVVIDNPDAAMSDRWRVRRETIETLRQLQNGDGQMRESDVETIRRANRLLAAYFRHIIGSEPPSMRWAFGEL